MRKNRNFEHIMECFQRFCWYLGFPLQNPQKQTMKKLIEAVQINDKEKKALRRDNSEFRLAKS